MQPTAQIWILVTNRSEAARNTADTIELNTCRSPVRGCAQSGRHPGASIWYGNRGGRCWV